MVNPTNITNSNHQPTINSFTLVDSFHCSRLTWRHPMGNNICNVWGGMKRITSISRDLMFFVRHTKYLVKGGCPNVCWPKKYQGPTMTFHTNLTKKTFTEIFPSIVQTFEYFGNFNGCCFFLVLLTLLWHKRCKSEPSLPEWEPPEIKGRPSTFDTGRVRWFVWRLLVLCSGNNANVCFQNNSKSYVVPSSKYDIHTLHGKTPSFTKKQTYFCNLPEIWRLISHNLFS